MEHGGSVNANARRGSSGSGSGSGDGGKEQKEREREEVLRAAALKDAERIRYVLLFKIQRSEVDHP